MSFGFVRAQNTRLHQSSNIRMITGKPENCVAAYQVKAAVPDMGEVKMKVIEGERGAGGAHALKFRMRVGVLPDTFVRGSKSLQERVPGIVGRLLIVDVLDRLYREPAGLLSAFVAAHAVSNHGESSLPLKLVVGFGLPVGGRVLIVGTLTADVRHAAHLNSCPHLPHPPLE